MVQTNNEEIGNLAKPRWVSFYVTLLASSNYSVVALLVKAISIPCEARLGDDALETYRILPRLFRGSLKILIYTCISRLHDLIIKNKQESDQVSNFPNPINF